MEILTFILANIFAFIFTYIVNPLDNLISYFYERITFKKYIEGKWEGVLYINNNDNTHLECTVIFIPEKKGFFSYVHYKMNRDGKPYSQGIDQLKEGGDSNRLFALSHKKESWKTNYSRLLHDIYEEDSAQVIRGEMDHYEYNFKVSVIRRNQSMNVCITADENTAFEGVLEKRT